MLTARVRIYPNTKLAEIARAEGYPRPELDPREPGQFYVSPTIDPEWLDSTLSALAARAPNVMFMEGSRSRAIPWIGRFRALVGKGGPTWTGYAKTRRTLRRFGLDTTSTRPRS